MNNRGFTLIELVTVIMLLGILSVTAGAKYIDLSKNALQAKVDGNSSALQAGINLAHTKWLVLGASKSVTARDDIQIFGNNQSGQIDINDAGWPAQQDFSSDTSLVTDNVNDCYSLWATLMVDGENQVAIDSSNEFIVTYDGSNICTYKLTENTALGFQYDSTTGKVEEIPPPPVVRNGGGSLTILFLLQLIVFMMRHID